MPVAEMEDVDTLRFQLNRSACEIWDPKDKTEDPAKRRRIVYQARPDLVPPVLPVIEPGRGSDGKLIDLIAKFGDDGKFTRLNDPPLKQGDHVWNEHNESLEQFTARMDAERAERQAKAAGPTAGATVIQTPTTGAMPPAKTKKSVDKLAVEQLLALAEEKEIPTQGSTKHAELVRLLKAAGVTEG